MEVSVIFDIVLSVLSFVLALLSIVFVIITLRQNNKMLYAGSRPYITGYFAYEENNSELFFCVKNCGNSSAIIKKFELVPDLEIMHLSVGEVLLNTMLAPNQQIHFDIPQMDFLMKKGPYQFQVEIQYVDVNLTQKTIKENYTTDISYLLKVLTTEHRKGNLNSIENTLYNLEKDVKAITLSNL